MPNHQGSAERDERSEPREAPPFLQVKCPPTFHAAPSETSEASLARRPPFLQINLRAIPCFATAPFVFTLGKSKNKTINKEYLQKNFWGLRLGIIFFFMRPDGRSSAAPVSSTAPKKKSFDRGGPVWPPRSNAADDRLGGGVWRGFAPPAQIRGVGGQRPPAKTRDG